MSMNKEVVPSTINTNDRITTSLKENLNGLSITILSTTNHQSKFIMQLWQKIVFYGLGSIFLLIGLLISGFWWNTYDKIVLSKLILDNSSSSETYPQWVSPDAVPLYFNIYMFNWTNAEQSLKSLEIPKFEEVGPYVFKLDMIRDNISFHNENGTVSYLLYKKWIYLPELSKADYNANITSPNAIFMSVLEQLAHVNGVLKFFLDKVFLYNRLNLFVTKPVRELLFEGYEDKLLDIFKVIKRVKPLPNVPDKFAWYLSKNGSNPDNINMFTGFTSPSLFGSINSWNNTNHFPAFEGKCSDVKSTIGDLWPFDVGQRQNVSLVIPDFCSKLLFENIGDIDVNGVAGVHLESRESTFDNGTRYPEFKCYCQNSDCNFPSGVRNITTCVKAPVFLSYPHFYLADEKYRKDVEGMTPNYEKHNSYFNLQKEFGVILNATVRLQLNLYLRPIPGFSMLEKMPTFTAPVLWFEEIVNLPPPINNNLYTFFTLVPIILTSLGLFMVMLGSILLVMGVLLTRSSFQSIPYVQESL